MGSEVTDGDTGRPGDDGATRSAAGWRVSAGQPPAGSRVSVDVGNAGTVLRFLPAVAA